MHPTYELRYLTLLSITFSIFYPYSAQATTQVSLSLTRTNNQICIESNGLPNHQTGVFPNSGNPHSIREQDYAVCLDAKPKKNATPIFKDRGAVGIISNGVIVRPTTADYYDPSSRRGFSRDSSSGWRLDGMGAAEILGLDMSNAHVGPRGEYHYHGLPLGYLAGTSDSHIGYAADGFEIHFIGDKATPSYQLKTGERPTAPGGAYDGTYQQDWIYVAGSGTLDECNGGMHEGRYVYFATEHYPFYPACFWGDISSDFRGL